LYMSHMLIHKLCINTSVTY